VSDLQFAILMRNAVTPSVIETRDGDGREVKRSQRVYDDEEPGWEVWKSVPDLQNCNSRMWHSASNKRFDNGGRFGFFIG
jgi:hypothetical protein